MQMSLPRCTAAMIPAQTRHQPSKIACRMRNIMFLPRKTELRDLPALKYASLLCRRGEIQKRACKDAPGVWGWGSLQPRAVGTRACIFEAAAWKHAPARGDWWRLLRNFLADCFTAISASDAQSLEAIGRYAGTSAGLNFVTFVVVLRFILACIIEKASKLHSCFVCLMARSLWVTPSGMIPHQPRFFFFQLTDFISRCIFFMRTFWNEKLLQWKTVIFNRYCTFIFPLENRKKTSFWPYWRLRVYSSIINFAQNLYSIRRVLEHWCSITFRVTNVDNRRTKLS